MRRSFVINLLFAILLLANLVFSLWPRADFNTLAGEQEAIIFNIYNTRIILLNSFIFLFLIIYERRIRFNSILVSILILEFFFIISLFFNLFENSAFAVFANPLSFIGVFCVLKNYQINKGIIAISLTLLLIWCILPLFLILFPSVNPGIILFSGSEENLGTFKGFAMHRNVYGFFAVLSFIALSLLKTNKYLTVIISLLLFIGVLICQSRSSLLAFASGFIYIYIRKLSRSNLFLLLAALAIFVTGFYILNNLSDTTTRYSNITNYEGRSELIQESLTSIHNNLLFGIGGNYISLDSDPVHNFILQCLLNYGIFTTLAFLGFLVLLFLDSKYSFRVFLLFLMVIGFFQPYFQFATISNLTLITFLMAIGINYNIIPQPDALDKKHHQSYLPESKVLQEKC